MALSTCSHSADVVLLYPRSRSDWIRVWPRNRGTRAPSFSARVTTVLPPFGAAKPHCGARSGAICSAPCVMSVLDCSLFVSDMLVLPLVVVAARCVPLEWLGRYTCNPSVIEWGDTGDRNGEIQESDDRVHPTDLHLM